MQQTVMSQATTCSPVTVVQRRSQLGEGAFWDYRHGLLYWVDILAGKVLAHDPRSGTNREWDAGAMVGAVVPMLSGGLLMAREQDFARLDLLTGAVSVLARLDPPNPRLRFNDGKCDPAGRFWAGTMDHEVRVGAGSLYCLDAQGDIVRKRAGTTISNGMAWSANRELFYYIDSARNDVRVWDFHAPTGALTHERVAITNEGEGLFDGMTIDQRGMLWIAVFGAGEVRQYNPITGECLRVLSFPVSQITSCAFGGVDRGDLFVTSGSEDFTDDDWQREPLAGSLFRVRPGVTGVPLPFYGG